MVKINIEDVKEIIKMRNKINRIPFDKIKWYKNGEQLNIPTIVATEFKYTGLNNTDFVAMNVYKQKKRG